MLRVHVRIPVVVNYGRFMQPGPGPIFFKCGVVDHKARNCTSQPHRYYFSEPRRKTPSHHDTRLVSNPVKHFSTSIKCIGSSPFVLKQEVRARLHKTYT